MAHALLKPEEWRRQRSDGARGEQRGARLLAIVGGVVLTGCYTTPINRPPSVTITVPGALLRGVPPSYTAFATDPDQDAISLSWAIVAGDCPADSPPGSWPANRIVSSPDPEVFVVPLEDSFAPFCVWAFATDAHGAVGVNHRAGNPQNRAPTATIDVLQPPPAVIYPLYTEFRLSAGGSNDPEGDQPLTFKWNLVSAPPNSAAVAKTCPGGDSSLGCFFADVPGPYVVSVDVEDPSQARGMAMVPLQVDEDQPPCIELSDPEFTGAVVPLDSTVAKNFLVKQVVDDGDPFPAGQHGRIKFSWFLGHGDQPVVNYDNDFYLFPIAANTFDLGETGRVRVEIHDRNTHDIDNVLLGCGDQPQCAAKPGCLQRITWNLEWKQ